ncbi:MAG: glycyl-radical enzyme activating protein [Clostridium sp.]|nr:glycyl-radical enzyme activating protein [Clostridium sp.]
MPKLMVFDLQRFALHDGPGIRTAVFLKGCPLDCVWCHNPESKRGMPQLGYLDKNCTHCGTCATICQCNVHSAEETGRHAIDFSRCAQCGRCVQACPHNALKIFGKQMSNEEVLNIVMKDWDFYLRSGGGLTVSGGEPMLQFDALLELLRKAKQNGLHVCLDTSGQASQDKYRAISEYVDIFLFDYKTTDPNDHKRYTGVKNTLILRNLDFLCTTGNDIYLRCPIIPGINDNEDHYRSISELSRKYDRIVQVNLMTYHDMAKGKSPQIGENYDLRDIRTIDAEEKQKIYDQVKLYGCLRLQDS